jgi:type IV pilus assembly protein PilO
MSGFLVRFMERSRPQKIGAWVGSLLLIGTTFWFYLYGDVRERVVQLKERHADLTTQIAKERALAKNLEGFRAEVQQLDADLRVALLELPDKKEIPDLLKSMSTLANQSGLEESLFRPMPEVHRDFYAEVPVSIALTGTFHQVAIFFAHVGKLSRIVNISQIAVKEPAITDAAVRIKAECTATTFRYLDEAEIARQAEVTDDKKKRRRP